jgi:hypothetical protein
MKLVYIITLAFISLLWSCNSKTAKEKNTPIEKTKTVEEQPLTGDFREQLKATEPATEQQFQSWLPERLGDFTRVEFTKSRVQQSDIASAGAIYKNGDAKKIELSIVDGASKDGLLAINSHYIAHNSELSSNNGSGFEKTYEHNGLKALETYSKNDNFYRILLFHNTRFGITIESYGISHEELWNAIDQIELETLNKL